MRWMLVAASVSALGLSACDLESRKSVTQTVEINKDGTTTTRTVEVSIGDAAARSAGVPGTETPPTVPAPPVQPPAQESQ